MTEHEKECLTCVQAKNFERLEAEQRGIIERNIRRDETIADIKVDTAITKEKVTHIVATTTDIKVSMRDFHVSTEKSLADFHVTTKESLKEVQTTIKTIEAQPGQNWRDLVKVAITVIATAAITLFLNK